MVFMYLIPFLGLLGVTNRRRVPRDNEVQTAAILLTRRKKENEENERSGKGHAEREKRRKRSDIVRIIEAAIAATRMAPVIEVTGCTEANYPEARLQVDPSVLVGVSSAVSTRSKSIVWSSRVLPCPVKARIVKFLLVLLHPEQRKIREMILGHYQCKLQRATRGWTNVPMVVHCFVAKVALWLLS
jgi:hypothetical protein